jgi:hypothetical protein
LLTPFVILNEVKDPSQLPGREGLLPDNVAAGKAVFGVEYKGRPRTFCPLANDMGFFWLIMNRYLDGSKRIDCLADY